MIFFDDEMPANIDRKGKELIENAKKAIATDKSNPNRNILIEEAMNAMYDHFSTYSEDDLNNFNLQIEIFKIERLLENEYLSLQTEPRFNENHRGDIPTAIREEDDATKTLDYIVYQTRKKLSKHHNLQTDSLGKQCFNTSCDLEEICSTIHLDTLHVGINQNLGPGMFHHFTIIRMPFENGENKNYLIDCTYRQFFTKADSNPRRIGVMRGPAKGCSIGSYMMMTQRRKEIAETILLKGYIEATPEVIKEYFDAVVYSGRDKSYYEEHNLNFMNPDDVIPNYTAQDYMQMLINNRGISGKSIHEVADEIINSQDLCPNQAEFEHANIQESKEKGENVL